jgi:hypothetical protein
MSDKRKSGPTLRDFEPAVLTITDDTRTSALGQWYESVRDKPLAELSVEDLCRCCRQEIYPEAIVPYAVERVERNPLAGELYDGELLAALSSISTEFWRSQRTLAATLVSVLAGPINSDDESVLAEIETLRDRTQAT